MAENPLRRLVMPTFDRHQLGRPAPELPAYELSATLGMSDGTRLTFDRVPVTEFTITNEASR